jgi:putative aldouronate transport system substrate-binding protein
MNVQAVLLHQGHGPAESVGAIVMTSEEEEVRVSHIRTDIAAFVNQSIVEFITGARDIYNDAEWRLYANEFEGLGIDILIETAQAFVDRR